MFKVNKFAFWSVVIFADVKHGIVYYGSTDYLYMTQQNSVYLSAVTYLLLLLMASKIYPAENTPKEAVIEPINTVHGSYHNNSLGKDKSCIEIIRTNPKKFKNLIMPIDQKRKMRRNRRKYKMAKKSLKPPVPNHLIPTLT